MTSRHFTITSDCPRHNRLYSRNGTSASTKSVATQIKACAEIT
jgi:hypothetical protein